MSSSLSLPVILLLVLNYAEGNSCDSETDSMFMGIACPTGASICAACQTNSLMATRCARTCCKTCPSSCNSCRGGSGTGSSCTTSESGSWSDRKWCYLADGLMAQYCDGSFKSDHGDYYYGSSACDNCPARAGYVVSINEGCDGANELGSSSKSFEQCAAACDADDTCVSFERRTDDNKNDCYLSNSCGTADKTSLTGWCNYEKRACPPMAGYKPTKDRACNGANQLGEHVATRAECKALCDNNHECVSFEVTTLMGDNQCWLSSSCRAADLTDLPGYCNYEKYCTPLINSFDTGLGAEKAKFVLYEDKACDGHNELTTSAHHGFMTLEECARFCAEDSSCISFEYRKSDKKCYRSTSCVGDHIVDYSGYCLYVRTPDLEWEHHDGKTCSVPQTSFTGSVEKAKEECFKDRDCGGVAQSTCGSSEVAYCLQSAVGPLNLLSSGSGCIYEKPNYHFHVRWEEVPSAPLLIQTREVEIQTIARDEHENTVTQETVDSFSQEASRLRSSTEEVNAGIEFEMFSAGASASETTEEERRQQTEFETSLINSVQQSYSTEFSKTTIIKTPSALDVDFMDYTVWCFKIDAGSYLDSKRLSIYNRASCRQKWGCGKEHPPNCLPGKCSHLDEKRCEKCIQPWFTINKNFYEPLCDPFYKKASNGNCDLNHRIFQTDNCFSASDVEYGEWVGVIDKTDQTCGCFVDANNKRYFNVYGQKACNNFKPGEKSICLAQANLCNGLLSWDDLVNHKHLGGRCPLSMAEQSIEVEVAAENDRLKEVNRALKKALKDLEGY